MSKKDLLDLIQKLSNDNDDEVHLITIIVDDVKHTSFTDDEVMYLKEVLYCMENNSHIESEMLDNLRDKFNRL